MNIESNINSLSGKTGTGWDGGFFGTGQKMKMQLRDNFIKTDTNSWWGNKRTIYTKIENISSVEVGEGRLGWLLIVGIVGLFFLIGIIFIIAFFLLKVKWLVIYTDSIPLVIIHRNDKQAEQFRDLILEKIQK